MHIKVLKLIGLFILVNFSNIGHSQVTIGSSSSPASGALLDLKQNETTTLGDANSQKGLLLPRVELTAIDKLKMGSNEILDQDDQYILHTGLMVYHINKCTVQGEGLYIWTGSAWEKLGENTFPDLSVSQSRIELASGYDNRASAPQLLEVRWQGAPSVKWTKSTKAGRNPIILVNPVGNEGNITVPSPSKMFIEAEVFLDTEIAKNRWASKESILKFENLECDGKEMEVILNQTNYALMVANKFENSQIIYNGKNAERFPVQGNATWKATVNDPHNIFTSITPDLSNSYGEDKDDGTTGLPIPYIEYTTNVDNKYYTADILFEDTHQPKRFKDITLSIRNCNTNYEMTIEEWAQNIGFTTSQIEKVLDALPQDKGGTSSDLINGYQLHRDQGDDGLGRNGNLFISSDFGEAGRWMIVHLAASTYAAESGRTGDDKQINRPLTNTGKFDETYNLPQWGYPTKIGSTNANDASLFNQHKRLGRLYNWAGATNNKGVYNVETGITTSSGLSLINDGQHVTNPQQATIQGICPNGWHIPSDKEWTDLENEIIRHTNQYSLMPIIGEEHAMPYDNLLFEQGQAWRPGDNSIIVGNGHGQAMKDLCPDYLNTNPSTYLGASNIMSSKAKGGFSVLLAGNARGTGTQKYANSSYIWSSSGGRSNSESINRSFAYDRNAVNRYHNGRFWFFSVRCKQTDLN